MSLDKFTVSYKGTNVLFSRIEYITLFSESMIAGALQDPEAVDINIETSDVTSNIIILLGEIVRSGRLIVNDEILPEEYTKAGRYLLIDELILLADLGAKQFISAHPDINLLKYDSLGKQNTYSLILDYALRNNCVVLAKFLFDHVRAIKEDSTFLVIASTLNCPEILRLLLKRVDDPSLARASEVDLLKYNPYTPIGHIYIATNQALALAVQYSRHDNVRILLGNDKIELICQMDDPDVKVEPVLEMADLEDREMIDLIVNDHRFDVSKINITWMGKFPYLLSRLLMFPLADPTVDDYECLKTAIRWNNIESVKILLADHRVDLREDIFLYSFKYGKKEIWELIVNNIRFTSLTPRLMTEIVLHEIYVGSSILNVLHHKFHPDQLLALRGTLLSPECEMEYTKYLMRIGLI